MPFLSQVLSSTFSRFRKQRKIRQKSHSRTLFSFQQLESRELLAGINLNAAGILVISGGEGNDVGQITTLSSTTVRASVTGVASQDFNVGDISSVTFLGLAGNDQFTNSTSLASRLVGGDGNDTLIGGSSADTINGGAGNDTLSGNAGDDRLVGADGADIVRAGSGDDIILGGDGLNELFGDAGNDLIFGGADVDRLFGGDGADVLVGLDGDDILDVGNGGIVGSRGTADADLALGFAGNDQITGGTGLNVLYGGDGDDIITGGTGTENRFHGQNGNDTLTGNSSNDFLLGQNGDDTFIGGGGNDLILTGQGDDVVDGGAGNDSVRFAGASSGFNIFGENSTVGVSQTGQGSDRLTNSENLQFADAATSSIVSENRAAVSAATRSVTVRPIVVSDNNGSNQAEFFGDAQQQLDIQLRIDEIFATAGIDINWETSRNFQNTTANNGGTGTGAVAQLQSITQAGDSVPGVGSSDSEMLDIYFVNQTPGGGSTSDLSTNGFAFIDANGAAFHTGSTLVTTPDFREVVARVAAHEIGHNLGLGHVNGAANLLDTRIAGSNLTTAQIATLQSSRFAQPLVAANLVGAEPASQANVVYADPTTPAGGCGGCGVCAPCTGG